MAKINQEALINFFSTIGLEGYANLVVHRKKQIEFDSGSEEVSFSDQDEETFQVSLFSEKKKMSLVYSGVTLEDIYKDIESKKHLFSSLVMDEENVVPQIAGKRKEIWGNVQVDEIEQKHLFSYWEKIKNFAYAPDIEIEAFGYEVFQTSRIFINSFGAHKVSHNSGASFMLQLFGAFWDEADSSGDSRSFPYIADISDEFILNIQQTLLDKRKQIKPSLSSGVHTISLDREVVASFLELICVGLNAENMRQKRSPFLLNQIGKKIFGENISLHNYVSHPESPRFLPFDGEGVDARDLCIVEKGVLKNIFLNTKNAQKLNMEVSGNPSPANFCLEGDFQKDYLKESSFLFTSFMGFHTISMSTGKFALEGEWYEIQAGKKVGFVKQITLVSSLQELFSAIKTLGDDILLIDAFLTPSITCINQNILIEHG